jgi:microcystin-dependent protein
MTHLVGTILLFPANFVPARFLACNGQALSIAKNQLLFSILGNAFGGSVATFNLPKMKPPSAGTTYAICADGEYPERP